MNTQELALALNEEFHSESVTFGFWGNSSLPAAFISNPFCTGAVSPYGAHVLSYVPAGKKDLLMMSAESPLEEPNGIRGGVPICWPWFGPDPKPAHGTARIQYWKLTGVKQEADGSDTLTFRLSVTEPHRLDVFYEVNFGAKLTMKLTTVNKGSTVFSLTDAIHTYFRVGEIEKTTISGLGGSQVENRVNSPAGICPDQFGFESETDNIYHSSSAVTITDNAWNRQILVEKSGSKTTVVWNPWIEKSKKLTGFGDEEYHIMVCVEAANCSTDRIELGSGESHTLTQTISEV
ncbi:MAG: putative glucose-6-phosphate 1-epimerase [Lentisphaerae bacterium ADurb.Bin242]|nr:MAG: putative glucose-6-phosphate 1-epimerase [Lentisphaerae bacterium ADurb.Bin242]